MNITLDQILCLKVVSQEGSLTKASEKLNRAKSAINYSLKNLEDQLGFKVLDKSGYRPKLTAKGEEFLFKSKNLLKEHAELLENIKQINLGTEMKLSLSISYNCSSEKLFNIIKKAMEKYPTTEIRLYKEVLSGLTLLKEETVDIALFEDVGEPVDYESIHLGKFNMQLSIANRHPFLKLPKSKQTLKNLVKYPQIIMSSSLDPDAISRSVEQDGPKWNVSDIYSKLDMISKGLGWGRIPTHFIGNKKITHLKHLDDLRKIDYYLCRPKNKEHGEVSQFIWDSFLN